MLALSLSGLLSLSTLWRKERQIEEERKTIDWIIENAPWNILSGRNNISHTVCVDKIIYLECLSHKACIEWWLDYGGCIVYVLNIVVLIVCSQSSGDLAQVPEEVAARSSRAELTRKHSDNGTACHLNHPRSEDVSALYCWWDTVEYVLKKRNMQYLLCVLWI